MPKGLFPFSFVAFCKEDVFLKAFFFSLSTEMTQQYSEKSLENENTSQKCQYRSMMNGKIQTTCQQHEKCVIVSHPSGRSERICTLSLALDLPFNIRINNISIFLQFIQTKTRRLRIKSSTEHLNDTNLQVRSSMMHLEILKSTNTRRVLEKVRRRDFFFKRVREI